MTQSSTLLWSSQSAEYDVNWIFCEGYDVNFDENKKFFKLGTSIKLILDRLVDAFYTNVTIIFIYNPDLFISAHPPYFNRKCRAKPNHVDISFVGWKLENKKIPIKMTLQFYLWSYSIQSSKLYFKLLNFKIFNY